MMDWQKIQDTLKEWFANISGLETHWFGEQIESLERPYAQLQVSSSNSIGTDDRREEYDDTQPEGEQIVRSIYGNRVFMLGCRVRTRDQTPTGAARWYLEKVRSSLYKISSLDVFKEANLALVGSEAVINLDTVFQQRQESEALLDIRFATAAVETDPRDRGTWIEKIEVSSDIKDPGGTSIPASLQFDEEEMP